MLEFHCAAPDCSSTKHEAHGFCKRHYRASRPRPKDAVTPVPCGGCGTIVYRVRPERWKSVHCSELCRHWVKWGAWSVRIPADHISRWVGATCTVRFPHPFECGWCGAAGKTALDIQRYCSRTCKVKHGKATRRGREYDALGTYSWTDVTRLWLAFGKVCAYCTTPTPLDQVQAEHVIPLSRGGRNDLANLLPSCGPCNSDKRDLLLHEWNPDRKRRHLIPVVTVWSERDPRYTHLTATKAA